MYIRIPKTIKYREIVNNNFSLSANQYKKFVIKNKNLFKVKDFLTRELKRSDLGYEVGSINYIDKSPVYFLRTKALQPYSYLPEFTNESLIPIKPQVFKNMNLKKGDLIISKDSNIGEIVILDKDYPNVMLSSALYKLPIREKLKYYLLAFIKHHIFREQLDFMVPSGATIRHAKTMFLDVNIPFPTKNRIQTVKYISLLTQAIINKEIEIRKKHNLILKKIEEELKQNQKPNKFKFSFPKFSEIKNTTRLDTGLYTKEFKEIDFMIKNYKNGYFYIEKKDITGGNTPKIRYIGNEKKLKYKWVTPTMINNFGNFIDLEEKRINFKGKNNINEDCILIINRTSKGGEGKYVGITAFYNYNDFGPGHHNQGIYKISKFEKEKLIFILTFFNCEIVRNYCKGLSIGSKMKELKIEQITQIPIPTFPESKQKEIALLYHNPEAKYDISQMDLNNFLEKDNEFNKKAGIYELDKSMKYLKNLLNKAIEKIANDEIVISFKEI